MDGEVKTKGVEFMLEHKRVRVGGRREIFCTPTLALPLQGGEMSRSIGDTTCSVIPAKAGIQCFEIFLDSRLRGSDIPGRLVIRSL